MNVITENSIWSTLFLTIDKQTKTKNMKFN